MELLSYAQAPRSRDPVRTHVQRLIEVVGTPRFEGEFVKALGDTTRSEHITAYAFHPKRPPRLLFAASNGPRQRETGKPAPWQPRSGGRLPWALAGRDA